jgi:hypothetical protein
LRDLDDVVDGHVGVAEDFEDVFPGAGGLSGDVGGEISAVQQTGGAGGVQPAEVGCGLDGVAVVADAGGYADVVELVGHDSAPERCGIRECGRVWRK